MIQSELKKLIEYVRDQCKMGFKVREDAASRLADAAEAVMNYIVDEGCIYVAGQRCHEKQGNPLCRRCKALAEAERAAGGKR